MAQIKMVFFQAKGLRLQAEIISELQFRFLMRPLISLSKRLSIWPGITLLDYIKQIRYLKFRNYLVHFIGINIIHKCISKLNFLIF